MTVERILFHLMSEGNRSDECDVTMPSGKTTVQFATVALARDVELLLSGRPPRRIRGPARNQDLELDLEIARGSKQGGILVLSANASHSKLRVVS